MKIAYTHHAISTYKIGGVSRYFYEIASRLSKGNDITVVSKYSRNLYFKDIIDNKEFLGKMNFKGKSKLEKYLQEAFMRKKLRNNDFDIIHHTGEESSVFEYCNNKPVVITLHDFIPEIYNYQPNRISLRKAQIERASAIICVSENTKNDLFKFYPNIDQRKVTVIYHGPDDTKIRYQENNIGDYLLYVGARTSYKNFTLLAAAIAPVLKNKNIKLVCTGAKFNKAETELLKSLAIQEHIINRGFVPDSELHNLYHHAKCFIYPSLYEGFGIPILESFKNGCPACVSNTSCFPEIAGDAALYFDPDNKNSIRKAVERIIENSDLSARLVKNGYSRLNNFSWDKAASDTLNVYRDVLNSI